MNSIEQQYIKDSGESNARMHDDNMRQVMTVSTIEQQIEALTQELRPYPEKVVITQIQPMKRSNSFFWYIEHGVIWKGDFFGTPEDKQKWVYSLFASTNKAEVEDYADCYRRLKLYQLLGEKAAKQSPLNELHLVYGVDFNGRATYANGLIEHQFQMDNNHTCLGGVWFARKEVALKALEICGITKEFQKRCAKYGIGGGINERNN